jgi:hypothetical protein
VHVIAGASPDNTPAGYYWTFLFPEILFIVIALTLWALFGRPHHRVPAQRVLLGMRSPQVGVSGAAATAAAPAVAASGAAEPAVAAPAEPSVAADESAPGELSSDGAGAGE